MHVYYPAGHADSSMVGALGSNPGALHGTLSQREREGELTPMTSQGRLGLAARHFCLPLEQ